MVGSGVGAGVGAMVAGVGAMVVAAGGDGDDPHPESITARAAGAVSTTFIMPVHGSKRGI